LSPAASAKEKTMVPASFKGLPKLYTHRQAGRERGRRAGPPNKQAGRQAGRQTDKQRYIQIEIDRYKYREIDLDIDRYT